MPHASHLCSICKQQCCFREPSVKEHECRAVQSAIYQLGCEIVWLQRQAWRVDAATCAACKSIDDCSHLHCACGHASCIQKYAFWCTSVQFTTANWIVT